MSEHDKLSDSEREMVNNHLRGAGFYSVVIRGKLVQLIDEILEMRGARTQVTHTAALNVGIMHVVCTCGEYFQEHAYNGSAARQFAAHLRKVNHVE